MKLQTQEIGRQISDEIFYFLFSVKNDTTKRWRNQNLVEYSGV